MRRATWGLLAVLLALGAAGAASGKPKPCPKAKPHCHAVKPKPRPAPAPRPTPQPVPAPAPPAVATYSFDAGVSPESQADTKAAVENTLRELDALGVPRFAFTVYADLDRTLLIHQFALHMHHTDATAAQVWAINGSLAIGAPGAFFVDMSNPNWARYTQATRWKILAHELFHVAQHYLAGGVVADLDSAIPTGGPRWLLEGTAEFFGYRAAAAAGLLDYETSARPLRARAVAEGTRLEDLGTQIQVRAAGSSTVYDVGFTASEYLFGITGLKPFVAYLQAITTGGTWQQAFERVFGRTYTDFVASFEAYRRTL